MSMSTCMLCDPVYVYMWCLLIWLCMFFPAADMVIVVNIILGGCTYDNLHICQCVFEHDQPSSVCTRGLIGLPLSKSQGPLSTSSSLVFFHSLPAKAMDFSIRQSRIHLRPVALSVMLQSLPICSRAEKLNSFIFVRA